MRDLNKAIDYIERGMLRGLDRKAAPSLLLKRPKPPIRAWRAPVTASNAGVVYPEQVFRPKDKLKDKSKDTSRDTSRDTPMARLTVTARAIKITVSLDVAEVASLPDPGGQARSQLAITCEGKIYIADIATKSLRKAKSTIAANGAEHVFVMVQGKLKTNEIIECGLVAQVKTPKPAEAVG
jgi:hypothetical protein